ncbi:PD40 domain-containing protein [Carboxylicivirga sediminis]|uniref:PD40 domain-containing protein n=1 Tax=Carboxylicivirga sediminis TaxID=2006564 RepID=A0A941FA90_9BACT|nr:OmpA family protein [Carboxylicivirga sediminis]MBR8537850.1 PD40 domain-containing protein [Carboxylicivirga sediminis]
MKPNSRISLLLLMLLFVASAFAQRSELKKAQEFLANEEYYRALEYYTLAGEKGAQFNTQVKIEIARCYFNQKNVTEALNRYDEVQDNLTGQDIVNFASCWHQEGGFELAIEWYEKAKSQGANPIDMDDLIKACKWAMENGSFNRDVVVNPASLLVGDQSFGIQYYEDGVVYSAEKQGRSKEVDRSGKGFLNLAFSKLVEGEIQEGSRSFSKNLESDYHVGATAFTSDFSRIFYTKPVRIKGGDSRLKIFTSVFDGEDWVDERELSINSDEYNTAYPAISPDNKYIYYSSTQRGGFGGKDLYRAEIKPSGTVGKGENLKSVINTFGDEEWPYIDKEGNLYFASNGHLGFGGLDVFKAEKQGDGFGEPVNLRQPINSGKDDFGYVLDPSDPTRGFLSSNRLGSGNTDAVFTIAPPMEEEEGDDAPPIFGLDEVPVVDMQEEAPVETMPVVVPAVDLSMFPGSLQTKITSTFNGVVIPGVTVEMRDANDGTLIATGVSGDDGRVTIVIPDEYKKEDQEFEIKFSKGDEFNSKRMIVNIMEVEDINNNGLSLTPIFKDDVLDDIGMMIIPYEGNEITKEGLAVLDELATYLSLNPNIVVKLNGHTEAKGNRYNNLNVSQDIAEKAEQILISKGINDEQMIPRGYGERYLKNKCKRGVYCSDSEHLINRRIEVVVWRMLK